MAFLTACIPDSPLRTSVDLVGIHRIFGLTALGLCAMAICTGIMEEFGKLLSYNHCF